MRVQVRVRSATTKELECAHMCVQTYIWTCDVRACDAKNGRNSHLGDYCPPLAFSGKKCSWKQEGRREGGLLFRAIQFLEKFVNKLLLFNFIVECKGKKLRTHSAEPLVEGLTFFQLSCPLFAVAAVCNGQLSSTIFGVAIKELQNWLFRNLYDHINSTSN